MLDYGLDFDEVLLVECLNVTLEPNGIVPLRKPGNLVLTNKNLIWATLTVFNKVKNTERYPLESIKQYDGKPQIKIEGVYLKVYFQDRQMSFLVMPPTKAKDIVNNVYKILTGTQENVMARNAIPGAEFIAGTIKDTVETFKDTFGIKSKSSKQSSTRCPSCNAGISGIKGQVEKCPYCGTSVIMP